ncbi:hypothetical protein DK842_22220 [Chromobacterium phragmitis]|uniref:hypothetical protein n=1 Tax=Chromobacterium phragmitis TaxID=2202141 RepID=UPI000DECC88D|nr:hypothetical protein [Chromobacterium phragmitis]AXE32389.1 hypothetical protein DK842_22220 [Chromobacterium phragmitis]
MAQSAQGRFSESLYNDLVASGKINPSLSVSSDVLQSTTQADLYAENYDGQLENAAWTSGSSLRLSVPGRDLASDRQATANFIKFQLVGWAELARPNVHRDMWRSIFMGSWAFSVNVGLHFI